MRHEAFFMEGSRVQSWLVLRCAPARTMAVARQLAHLGAWTPTWKRMRRVPRANVKRLAPEACIPSFVFLPEPLANAIPDDAPCRPMRIDGARVTVTDRQLEPLRQIADKPAIPARKLPRAGEVLRFLAGPFQGLDAKIIRCSQRYATVTVEGFAQPLQVPPSLFVQDAL